MALWLVRHGETEWSISGQHTSFTDLPLTPDGELQAVAIGKLLAERDFDRVLSSPRQRAARTAQLAGFGDQVRITEDLCEVDYGEYEGLTTHKIWEREPGWQLFRDGSPSGESPETLQDASTRSLPGSPRWGRTCSCSDTDTASARSPRDTSACRSRLRRRSASMPARSRSSRPSETVRACCCGTAGCPPVPSSSRIWRCASRT